MISIIAQIVLCIKIKVKGNHKVQSSNLKVQSIIIKH